MNPQETIETLEEKKVVFRLRLDSSKLKHITGERIPAVD
jgi:hypothetical protein